MPLPPEVESLIQRFNEQRRTYESPSYLEARVRIDFLNPLFSALGWDVANTAGVRERDREVITEGRIAISGAVKAPDYIFQSNGKRAFIVEAKKPSVNLRDDPGPALQLRRYGWNANDVGLGILTDFQEFAIYDCRVQPSPNDRSTVALVDYYTFDQFLDVWDEIESRFSREAVLSGALDEYARTLPGIRGKRRVDRLFLEELETWRKELAVELAENNHLTQEQLNYATHITIDRIVFLRICEDRGIEPYGDLRESANLNNVYSKLAEKFLRADEKYNSGLFHFKSEPGREEHDTLTQNLIISDSVLHGFINRLYWPNGPYDFSAFPPDVLGHVYEQFLGKVIQLTSPSQAVIEDKPEVRKAGGVYYTPTHIVHDIIQLTLGPRLRETNPEKITKNGLYICDPSCGSGSFLIEVYQFLLDWHLDHYLKDTDRWSKSRLKRLQKDAQGEWRLTTAERKRILLNHVFGVDIDQDAVEVTKLSLLLKVLEGETESSLYEQAELFHERVLPDLSNNIKCGNSLVGNAFYLTQSMMMDPEIERRINAFDWPYEFPNVGAGRGFDVIVGNPPWLMAGYYVADSINYLHDNFRSAQGKFDLYYTFIEQSFRLLAPSGTFAMIVPSKFFHTRAAKGLRGFLSEEVSIETLKDFGTEKVFASATNYSCIISARKGFIPGTLTYSRVKADLTVLEEFEVNRNELSEGTWSFQDKNAKAIFKKLSEAGTPLQDLVERFGTGVQTGSDAILTFTREQATEIAIEEELLRPLLRGRDVRGYRQPGDPKIVLFPYSSVNGEFRILEESEMEQYPKAWDYLLSHRDALAKRVWFNQSAEELSGKWYGLMYVEQASSFDVPHLLTPSLSDKANFTVGSGDLFATGTAGVTSIIPVPGSTDEVYYLMGVLNSDALSVYAVAHSPVYQGGYRKFSSPYLKKIPIPRPDLNSNSGKSAYQTIVRLAKDVYETEARLSNTLSVMEQRMLKRRIIAGREEINDVVSKIFGLTTEDRTWVRRKYANSNNTSESDSSFQ